MSALPQPPGGAVGRLSDRGRPDSEGRASTLSSSGARGIVHDLASLAAFTTALSSQNLQQGLERALDILREATGAESAELYLVEPTSHDLLLTAYRGPFRGAFCQVVRFKTGEGFPGQVTARREPILTNALPEDPRFLRTSVTRKGYRSYVCVPLLDPEGVLGVICVGARHPDADLAGTERLLSWVGAPLAIALRAGLLQARQLVSSPETAPDEGSGALDRLLQAVLRHTCGMAQADGGALILLDGVTGRVTRRVTEGTVVGASCPAVQGSGTMSCCPALAENQGIVLHGSRRAWPIACQRRQGVGVVTYCLPMRVGDEVVGVMEIVYQHDGPSPPTRYLRVLLEMAAQAAGLVKRARDDFEQQRRVETAYRPSLTLPSGPMTAGDAREPLLQIRCLGPFELYRQGQRVTPEMFKRRKALLLLKFLLVHSGHPVGRDTLIELLWPEIDPSVGANRLHGVVHALRDVVEPPETAGRWLVIRSEGDQYLFDPQIDYWLDLAEFRAAVTLGRRAEAMDDEIAAARAYDAAVHLYRGDLLADEPFAEWCWLEREHLRETFLGTLQKLAALQAELGDLEQAIAYYRQALRFDPLREEIQRRMMRCLWRAGRRDEALRQFERFRSLLQRELDIAPLPETEELAQQIRNEQPV